MKLGLTCMLCLVVLTIATAIYALLQQWTPMFFSSIGALGSLGLVILPLIGHKDDDHPEVSDGG